MNLEPEILTVTSCSSCHPPEKGKGPLFLMRQNLPGDLLVCWDDSIQLYSDNQKVDLDVGCYSQASVLYNLWEDTTTNRFRHNVAKFVWKVFAMKRAYQVAMQYGYDYLMWLDADVYVRDVITLDDIEDQIDGCDLAWLDRPHFSHGETGLIIFDAGSPWTYHITYCMASMYDNKTIFMMKEWHDAYLMSFLIWNYEPLGMRVNNMNQAEEGTEAFQNSPFADRMMHVK